jgi:hypothetical protein
VTRQVSARGAAVVAKAGKAFDYDLVIIGCGVGGHGAALHAVEQVRIAFTLDHRLTVMLMQAHRISPSCLPAAFDRRDMLHRSNTQTSCFNRA